VLSDPTVLDAIRPAAKASDRLMRANDLDVPPEAMVRTAVEGVIERVIPGVSLGVDHDQHPLIEAAAWTTQGTGS
jgi:hypothetical protein